MCITRGWHLRNKDVSRLSGINPGDIFSIYNMCDLYKRLPVRVKYMIVIVLENNAYISF